MTIASPKPAPGSAMMVKSADVGAIEIKRADVVMRIAFAIALGNDRDGTLAEAVLARAEVGSGRTWKAILAAPDSDKDQKISLTEDGARASSPSSARILRHSSRTLRETLARGVRLPYKAVIPGELARAERQNLNPATR